jgi:predicted SAM-dependent methyltransferase
MSQSDKAPMSSTITEYLNTRYRSNTSVHHVRLLAKYVLTAAASPMATRKARQMVANEAPIKLHLGSGENYIEGWTNIDRYRPGRRIDLVWDLNRALPFQDGSVSAVFSEHVFEHFNLLSAMSIFKDCRRVLAKGGVFRIGVPNMERYVRSYLERDTFIDEKWPGLPTRAIALEELFYCHGHRAAYDASILALMLDEAGFDCVHESTFGESRLDPSPDSEHRHIDTLYVEAIA